MDIICGNILEGFGLDHDGTDIAHVSDLQWSCRFADVTVNTVSQSQYAAVML